MRKKRILIAEDQRDESEYVEMMLQDAGYEVVVAEDGLEALKLARDEIQAPDLIVLDLRMPKIDGYKICRRLKQSKKHRHIPIIMLTGLAEAKDKQLGLASEADDYITKPFRQDELLERIRYFLSQEKEE